MATTNEQLIDWFNRQSVWIKDAVKTYYTYGTYTENDINRFVQECLDEVNGKKKLIDISGLDLLTKNDRENFAIKSIKNIEGVNALASGQELNFGAKGITVVYGENGAGKSGYIRIFKKLSDAKYKENLKENVYDSVKKNQSCELEVVNNNGDSSFICDLSKDGEYPLLKDIDIFDTKISSAYISDANEASYEPWVFSLFREIANAASLIKKGLDVLEDKQKVYNIIIPEGLKNSNTGKILSKIEEKTILNDSFFAWNEEDDRALEDKIKKANFDVLNSKVQELEREIGMLIRIKNYFSQFESFFSAESIKKINDAKKALEDAQSEQKAAQILFSQTASDLDKESISNKAWKDLWKDAEEYYNTFLKEKKIKHYTEEDGVCPLCGQIIDSKHIYRIKSVNEYINGNISQKVEKSKKAYSSLIHIYPQVWAKEQLILYLEGCNLGKEKDVIIKCVSDINDINSYIQSNEVEKFDIKDVNIKLVIDILSEKLKSAKDEKQAYTDLLSDEEHEALTNEINELKARKFAFDNKETIKNIITYLKAVKLLNDAKRLTLTTKITTKSKELGEELITEDYINRFNHELTFLTKGTVKASLKQQKAVKGRVPFKIVLKDVNDESINPADIFSEGERRVVSLAAFFAESSGKETECPLIVDDPISSLDLNYEELVINRLVEAGKHRQVIVFTHRLSMIVGLNDKCSKNNVAFLEKELFGGRLKKGVPKDNTHTGGKTLGKLRLLA